MPETHSPEDGIEIQGKPMVAAVIVRDGKMLLAKNIKHGGMRLEPPGGKTNDGESPEEAVMREGMEEMGRELVPVQVIGVYPTKSPEGPFNVHMILCDMEGDPVEGLEPGKIGGFVWLSLEELSALAEKNAAGDLSVTLVPNIVAALGDLAKYLEIA